MFIKVLAQVAIFFAIYLAVSWWQVSQLLSDNISAPTVSAISYADDSITNLQRKLEYSLEASATASQQADHFKLPSTMDDMVDLAASDKPTILYFFAPWCQICHLSIDNLQDFYMDNPDVDIIAIALDYKSQKEVTDFTLSHQLTFPVVFGDYKVKQHFKIFAYPSYYFLDTQNNIQKRSVGYTSSAGLYFSRLFI